MSSPSGSFAYPLWTRCKYQDVCPAVRRTRKQILWVVCEYQKASGKPCLGWKTLSPVSCICCENGSLIFVTNKRNCFQPGALYSKCRSDQLSGWLSVAAQRIIKLSASLFQLLLTPLAFLSFLLQSIKNPPPLLAGWKCDSLRNQVRAISHVSSTSETWVRCCYDCPGSWQVFQEDIILYETQSQRIWLSWVH